MVATSALKKMPVTQANDSRVVLGNIAARTIADVWMNIAGTENALAQMASMQSGILAWSAAPTMQLIMASMAAPVMEPTDRVYCSGYQSYPWSMAVNADARDVACQYLGKILPTNIQTMSIEDICAAFDGEMSVVSMHIESEKGWNDVRAISAAAVKSETPIMLLVSSAVAAPKGAAVETLALSVVDEWQVAAAEVQTAMSQVREQGAIRVIACVDDVAAASAENAMMESAGMNPIQWDAASEESMTDGERAMWSAWQAPAI